MELKPFPEFSHQLIVGLLIVPYGIETSFAFQSSAVACLLIVPYGIETL